MLFLGMANAYVMRTNMSVAIVAMVNHTAIGTDSDDTAEGVDEECGVDSTNSVSRDEKTDRNCQNSKLFCFARLKMTYDCC